MSEITAGPTHRRRGLATALTGLALAVVLTASLLGAKPVAATEAEECLPGAVGCFPRMAFGASTTGLPRSTAGLYALESALGRDPDIVLTFTSFRFAFDNDSLRALALSGAMPMITWEPFDALVPEENRYPLRDIADGAHDTYLRAQAARIRAIGERVAIRFGHEMNGDWYPWGAGVNGNAPADYVDAYRHVHDLFHAEGVRNVTWVWSPSALDTLDAPDLADYYPGDEYVDWAGLSAYFDQPTDTWANTVQPTVDQLDRVAPTAPIYLTETAVLPGPTRPAMISDLLGNLLRTPRAIGFTWFNIPSREDWRIDSDPAALDAVRDALDSGWYWHTGSLPAPLNQTPPTVQGSPRVGETLLAGSGAWRGAEAVSGRWLLCTDADVSSCVPAGEGASLVLAAETRGRTLRYEVTATADGRATTAVSEPTGPVQIVPDRPAPPVVEARNAAARVAFPVAPVGATHWRLTLDGKPYQLVPVGTASYWLTGLTNGTTYALSLTAVASSSAETLESEPTSGTFVPMTQQYNPYLSVTGTAASFTLPKAPVGAQSWVLTVDGTALPVPLTTKATTVTVPTGRPVTWSLAAAAGTWDDGPGSLSVPSTGSLTALDTPAAPVVTPGAGSITLTFPTPPTSATRWRVSVGATTYPDLPVGTPSFTATGLYPGYPSTWTLRAVNDTARSLPVTGKAAAR